LLRHPRNTPARRRTARVLAACVATVVAVAGCLAVAAPAQAAARPTVTSLSRTSGPYWGATLVTIHGTGLQDVTRVLFEKRVAYDLHIISATKLTVLTPSHRYGTVHVRVVAPTGTSVGSPANRYTFARPTMTTPIMGGLTARQEQRISARVRAAHRRVYAAPRRRHWTPAMGLTAVRRARSWLGVPYSWAGGNGAGPTYGVCAHNGGDLDCHVIGFDCSGLALNAWAPYESLVHYAATQHVQAGRFHPTVGQLVPGDLVFFSGYIADGIGHVAVYIGHGMVIQAPQSGTTVMRSRLVDVIAESGVYRGATRPMSTGRQGYGPRIASATSVLPVAGGKIRITGRHLDSVTTASVGKRMVYRFVKQTSHELVLTARGHAAGRVSLAVSTPWGTARRTLRYVGSPQVTALHPASGPTTGNTRVTVVGSQLDTVSRVQVGGSSVAFHVVDGRHLQFVTPAHAAGAVPIVLTSPFGTSRPVTFTYADTAPSTTPGRSTGRTARSGARPTHRTRTTSAPPRAVPGEDRIGEGWYLVGRRYLRTHQGG
jgi:cell wall-associated NlpC family hydrolase